MGLFVCALPTEWDGRDTACYSTFPHWSRCEAEEKGIWNDWCVG